ncbi:hypothetical protein EDC04DRAFT_2893645 [Pisolithus marmoratus]|nr:hypothetical protein EDC04DRAFT_2893645 [Pisolithus marmoratus]
MTNDTPHKKIKEDISLDNLRSCSISVVQTSGPGQRTSTQANESCVDLPKDPDANPGSGCCVELCPWADCSASAQLFPFRDLPLPQFSAINGSSETNVPSAQHPSMLLPPERMMTESLPPLDCVHMCKSLPDPPAMLPGSQIHNAGLNDDNIHRNDDHLNIKHGDSNNTCQVHHDLPNLCISDNSGDINLPTMLLNCGSHDTCPVHLDLPDLCIGNNSDELPAVPAVLPCGSSHDTCPVHLDLPDLCISNNSDDKDLPVVPAMLLSGDSHDTHAVHLDLPDLCISNDDGNNVYEQGDDHLNTTNGNHQDTLQICPDSLKLCIVNDGDNIDLTAVLPDNDCFDIENSDNHDTSSVCQDLPDLCTANGDDNTNPPAMLLNGDNVYGQDNDHPCITNSDSHDTSQACQELPNVCISNNSDDIELPAMLLDGSCFDFGNEGGNHVCQAPHDDDINLPAEVNGDKNDTSQVHCNSPDACIGVNGNDMDIKGGSGGNADGHDDASGNNRNSRHVGNAGSDINGSDDNRESIDILDTNGEYMDEDYYADYNEEGKACHDSKDVLRTYPEAPQGRQTCKQPQHHGHTAHKGKQKNCCGESSSWQTWSGMDKDIALGQLLNSNKTQPVMKGDLVILASAILDLQGAITQHGIGDPTLTMSKPLPATQPTSTVPEPVEGSDDPTPHYRWKSHNKQKLNLQVLGECPVTCSLPAQKEEQEAAFSKDCIS